MDFNGTKCVERISAFAGRSITGVISGQGCPENNSTATPRGIIANRADDPLGAVDPEDEALYSGWDNPPTTPHRA